MINLFTSIFILFTLINCVNKKDFNPYGLRNVEIEKEIVLKDSIQNIEFNITPKYTSNDIEIKLYFTSLAGSTDDLIFGGLKDEIFSSLNGLSIEIIEKNHNEMIFHNTISEDKNDRMGYSFAKNDHINMWINANDLKFVSGRDLVLKLQVPKKINGNEISEFILVIGVTGKTYL